MAFFNDKQKTESKQQTEQENIFEKQQQLIKNIQSVSDADLQHNMLDKFMPYTHKSLKIVTAVFNFVYSANFVGFQNVLAKKISEADIKAIIQAVRGN